MIFDHLGQVVSVDQAEHAQIYPKPGWVEHDPLEIWQRTQDVIGAAVEKAGLRSGDLAAVGVANQRETTVVWDKTTGEPYYNAIVWQDTRTKTLCDRLAAEGGQDRFRQKTGLPLATYFSGPKIRWLLDNVEGAEKAAERGEALFGNMDTWIIWWLTGGPEGGAHVTDVTNASRTLLMNLETLNWDREILKIIGVPHQMLPQIVSSSDPNSWGSTLANGPFGEMIPVCGDLGDQQAAAVGQACYDIGDVKNTYGTGCFLILNTGQEIVPSTSGLLTTVAYRMGDQPAAYALEGSIAITGALVQWLRDNLGIIRESSDVEQLALEADDNGGIYFVPAFSGLFAPYWRSDARGVIVGLTSFITKAHIARAALEATAYQTREVLEAMASDSGVKLGELKVDGGMVYNELIMQFQADVLGVTVVRPKVAETTSLGSAYAAGLAVGFWDDLEDLSSNWQLDKSWEPNMTEGRREELYAGWLKAVERSFDWVD
jgi:glycerol kinase